MLQESGCFAIVLEHSPGEIGSRLKHHLSIPVIGRGDGRRSAAGRQQANVAALPGKCSPLFRKLFVYPRLRLLVGLAGGGWLVQGGSHLRSLSLIHI